MSAKTAFVEICRWNDNSSWLVIRSGAFSGFQKENEMSGDDEIIRSEWRLLMSRWNSVRAQWRDPVAAKFEREFWQQFEVEVPRFLKAMEDLQDVLARATRATD